MISRERQDCLKYRPKLPLYIALLDLDFSWYPAEVTKVVGLWRRGKSVHQIAKAVGRDPDEVTVLIMSLAREKKIAPRSGGAAGLSA